jgi:hypothetical protein
MPPEWPQPRGELGQNECAYCHQEGHSKNEHLPWPRDPQRAPQTRGRGQVVEEKYQLAQGKGGPWEKDIGWLANFEDYEED